MLDCAGSSLARLFSRSQNRRFLIVREEVFGLKQKKLPRSSARARIVVLVNWGAYRQSSHVIPRTPRPKAVVASEAKQSQTDHVSGPGIASSLRSAHCHGE